MVGFSVPKTELIHWRTPLQRDSASASFPPPICLDGQIFSPLPCVRWLGYWFTPNLTSSAHFSKRLGLAQGAFTTVKRLSPPGSGLSPHLSHLLTVHYSSLPFYMVLTSWSLAEECLQRWTSTGTKSNAGFRTASCQPLYLYCRLRPAFPHYKPLSLISAEWPP